MCNRKLERNLFELDKSDFKNTGGFVISLDHILVSAVQ